jgi:ubiquitin fusion degradation protein 1
MGDSIMVAYNNRQYYIGIVEAKPAFAVSIIEKDCEVDFAPGLIIVPANKTLADLLKTKILMWKMNQNSNHLLVPENGWMVRVQNNKLPKSLQLLCACTSAPTDSDKRANQQSASSKKEAQAQQKETVKVSESLKKEEPKFNAFTGKKEENIEALAVIYFYR